MPVPIICLDENVCHFAERFRKLLSKPQYQYFVTVLGRTEPLFLGSALGSCRGGRTLAEALSRDDAAAGGSRAAATTPRATQASRSSQATRGDRVSDRGRPDDAQAEGQEDGRAGAAPLDHGGETHPRS